jgi:hypothetical protein
MDTEKSKDNIKARVDLTTLCDRPKQEMQPLRGRKTWTKTRVEFVLKRNKRREVPRTRTLSCLQRGQEEAREQESEESPAWEPEEDERVAADDEDDEDVDLGADSDDEGDEGEGEGEGEGEATGVPRPLLRLRLSGCEGPMIRPVGCR